MSSALKYFGCILSSFALILSFLTSPVLASHAGAKITDLRITGQSSSSITISLSSVPGATTYDVWYKKTGSNDSPSENKIYSAGSDETFNYSLNANLFEQNAKYDIWVNACDDGFTNCSDPSNPVTYDPTGGSNASATAQTSSGSGCPPGQTCNVTADNYKAPQHSDYTVINLIDSLLWIGQGYKPGGVEGLNYVIENGKTVPKIMSYIPDGGALGASTKMMALMYINQPASGIQYVADAIRSGFNIAPSAYAQVGGTGELAIRPVQKLWQLSRNIAYIAFILVFVAVGIMIIFRRRLNQQTVISVQNALPGIVVALILVTFSYFIAGFIIDLAFVFSQLVGILIISQFAPVVPPATTPTGTAITTVQNILNSQNVVSLFSSFAINSKLSDIIPELSGPISDIFGLGGRGVMGLAGAIAGCLGGGAIGTVVPILGNVVGCLIGGGVGAAGGAIAGSYFISTFIMLVLLIGLLQAMFRLLFSLINSYVVIIINTILGPLMILASAIPGQGALVNIWFRGLLGNVLVFPAVFALFVLVAAILGFDNPWYLNSAVGTFTQTLPLFGGVSQGFVRLILAYGLMLAAPGIPDFIRQLLGAQTNQILTRAIEQGIQGGRGGAQIVLTRTIQGIGAAIAHI